MNLKQGLVGICVLLIFLASGCGPSPKVYRLKEKVNQADFDYKLIDKIDEITPGLPRQSKDSKYQLGDLPVTKGKYTLYKFESQYRAASKFSDKPKLFHDLLVLKVDQNNQILDGYHYTLEWTDAPSVDLYRVQSKGLTLKNGLKVNDLKLFSPGRKQLAIDWDITDESGVLSDNGTIVLP